MKKILLSAVLALCSSTAFAAQQPIPYTGDVKWKVAGQRIHDNFTDLYTNKAGKPYINPSAPADTTTDWYDTDQEVGVYVHKRHNGTTWVRVGSYGVQYASSCASITAGMCVDTDDGKLYYHNGTAVVEVGVGSGSYTLPTAAADTLGGIKVGSRLTITDGVLSADVQSGGATAINDLTDVDTTGKATGKVLKFDASGNLVVGDDEIGAAGSGDITGITAGTGLTGGGDTGAVTLGLSTTITNAIATIPTISDAAYGSGWNGDTGAASKNAIYDKIEAMGGGVSLSAANTWTALQTFSSGISASSIASSATDGAHYLDVVNGVAISSTATLGRIAYYNGRMRLADGTDWDGYFLEDTDASANGLSLIGAANYAAMRTLLDLEAGTDFNSYDADLTTWAGITPGTGVVTMLAIAPGSAGGPTTTIASGTSALGTGAISSGACASVVTTTATNTATTDVINWGFNSSPAAVTGYVASANGMLTIIAYPSSGNVNFLVCNNTAASITPGAVTLNWRIQR